MKPEQWEESFKNSANWAIRIGFDLLHSKAFQKLDYAPAIKLLCWFHEKIKIKLNKSKRGKKRYEMDGNSKISFTYREAQFRGLSSHQMAKGLKELYRLGFIDIEKPGSALEGDWTEYKISERWKFFGTQDFKELEYPRSDLWINYGFKKDA